DVDEAATREIQEIGRGLLRRLVIARRREGVGQAGVRVGGDIHIGDRGDLLDVRAHELRPQRAVESDRERPGVAHRIPECFGGLAGERPSRSVGDGAGNDYRDARSSLVENLFNGKNRGFGVQRIEYGFDEEYVHPSFDQPAYGLTVCGYELVE